MNNVSIIAQLQALGPLPDGSRPEADDFPFNEFDGLIQGLEEPLSAVHTLALINLGPPANTGAFGVEWTLIHAAEIISITELQTILGQANATEVKRIIEIRLANSKM